MQQLLEKLKEGGSIVSSNDCSQLEIAEAKACDRMHVDENGFGFIYFPKKEKMINIQDDDGHWYYIPKNQKEKFVEMLEEAGEKEDHGDFINEFDEYRTGGGPHED